MKIPLNVEIKDEVIFLASDIVYAQRNEWCGGMYRPLKLSLMKPRQFWSYDKKDKYPVIVWLCGGAFSEQDRLVWSPEMVYFAKHGYAIACVDYTVTQRVRFPDPVVDIKEAIRFLRANADRFNIDADHLAIMGESAGGYLSMAVALTNGMSEYDKGSNLEYSSDVQAAIPFYGPGEMEFAVDGEENDGSNPDKPDTSKSLSIEVIKSLPNLFHLIKAGEPPFLMFHGTVDLQVPIEQGVKMHDALEAAGNDVTLYMVEAANHCDQHFVQGQVKDLIVEFLDKHFKASK